MLLRFLVLVLLLLLCFFFTHFGSLSWVRARFCWLIHLCFHIKIRRTMVKRDTLNWKIWSKQQEHKHSTRTNTHTFTDIHALTRTARAHIYLFTSISVYIYIIWLGSARPMKLNTIKLNSHNKSLGLKRNEKKRAVSFIISIANYLFFGILKVIIVHILLFCCCCCCCCYCFTSTIILRLIPDGFYAVLYIHCLRTHTVRIV